MKTLLIGAVSALALISAAGAATAQDLQEGYVGADYTRTKVLGTDINITSARAVGSFELSDAYELQLDGDLASVDYDFGKTTIFGPTAHLFADGGNYKAGAFLGYHDAEETDLFGAGVEARFFPSDDWSAGGSVAWGSIDLGAANIDLLTIRGEGSYFVNDGLRLDAFASQTSAKVSILSLDLYSYGAGGEYQISGTPASLTFGYEHSKLGDFQLTADTYSIGARYVFGGSLRDRDRNSAPFHGLGANLGGPVTQAITAALGGEDLGDLGDIFGSCSFLGNCGDDEQTFD